MHDGEIERVLQLLELVAKGHAIPLAVGVEEEHRTHVLPIGHRPQHADQAGDADSSGDQSERRALVLIDREDAVRTVDIHGRAGLELADPQT